MSLRQDPPCEHFKKPIPATCPFVWTAHEILPRDMSLQHVPSCEPTLILCDTWHFLANNFACKRTAITSCLCTRYVNFFFPSFHARSIPMYFPQGFTSMSFHRRISKPRRNSQTTWRSCVQSCWRYVRKIYMKKIWHVLLVPSLPLWGNSSYYTSVLCDEALAQKWGPNWLYLDTNRLCFQIWIVSFYCWIVLVVITKLSYGGLVWCHATVKWPELALPWYKPSLFPNMNRFILLLNSSGRYH